MVSCRLILQLVSQWVDLEAIKPEKTIKTCELHYEVEDADYLKYVICQ